LNISKAELRVLQVLWQEQPLTVGQIIERVQASEDWHDNTIKTLLVRLTEKKAVNRYKDGRRFFYAPLINKGDVVETEAAGLLERFFNGQMAPLVAHFAKRKKLTKKDIDEIEKILNELKKSK